MITRYLPPGPIEPDYSTPKNLLSDNFTIVLPFTTRSFNWCNSFEFRQQNPADTPPNTWRMLFLSDTPRSDHRNNIW